MIAGTGTDLVSVDMLRREMARNPALAAAVFSPDEVAYCEAAPDPMPRYAARFAAKEAVMKALGTGWGPGADWLDVVVVEAPGGDGPPAVELRGEAAARAGEGARVHLSLSHEAGLAVAFAVIERPA
ncbi:MAG: holo-ACP synthase [Deltaproteobacteria bacterium]|nr:holo-ACP synthase [Deltaproteobacteria bacterium]